MLIVLRGVFAILVYHHRGAIQWQAQIAIAAKQIVNHRIVGNVLVDLVGEPSGEVVIHVRKHLGEAAIGIRLVHTDLHFFIAAIQFQMTALRLVLQQLKPRIVLV